MCRQPDGILFEIWSVHLDSRYAAMHDPAAVRILEALSRVERTVVGRVFVVSEAGGGRSRRG